MAFQVKDLMVAVEPDRIACGGTEVQCPTASATIVGVAPANPDSKRNLELLRRIMTGREH